MKSLFEQGADFFFQTNERLAGLMKMGPLAGVGEQWSAELKHYRHRTQLYFALIGFWDRLRPLTEAEVDVQPEAIPELSDAMRAFTASVRECYAAVRESQPDNRPDLLREWEGRFDRLGDEVRTQIDRKNVRRIRLWESMATFRDRFLALPPAGADGTQPVLDHLLQSFAKDLSEILRGSHDLSAEFPYEPKFVEVNGAQMHYVDEGEGPVFLLVHGNPTSSYLWRNVIPELLPAGRVVAPDLIGMGRSAKPPIAYSFEDQVAYFEGFIAALGLTDLTLVLHDWGGALGLHFASRNPQKVRAIVVMEALVMPFGGWNDIPLPNQWVLKWIRHPERGKNLILERNFFVEVLLPMLTMRKLSAEEMEAYRAPFPDRESRLPTWRWPSELPFDGKPVATAAAFEAFYAWFCQVEIPKLLLWVEPGAILSPEKVDRLRREVRGLEAVKIGRGRHYVQEDHPGRIGREIVAWSRGFF